MPYRKLFQSSVVIPWEDGFERLGEERACVVKLLAGNAGCESPTPEAARPPEIAAFLPCLPKFPQHGKSFSSPSKVNPL